MCVAQEAEFYLRTWLFVAQLHIQTYQQLTALNNEKKSGKSVFGVWPERNFL